MTNDEALLRYPESDGMHDGHRCVCTNECPPCAEGDKYGCRACEAAWIDAGLDRIIGASWATAQSLGADSDPVQ